MRHGRRGCCCRPCARCCHPTRPVMEVLTALRADHWLHSHGGGDQAVAAQIRRQMRDAFYTDTTAWQAAVYGRTADLAFRALRGLAE
ncbi:MAG: DUF2817 domain-containing protein [Steroidobacteraceae bacterium]